MKKVLIWNTFILHERSGGPSTYLYNLRKFVRDNGLAHITFLNDVDATPNKKVVLLSKKSIIPKFIRNVVRINQNLSKQYAMLQSPHALSESINVNDFDVIHFHSTIELYQSLPVIEHFKGTVVLTSHTPMAPHLEIIGDAVPLRFILSKTKKAFQKVDEIAFRRADVLLFPSKHALEPYQNTWSKFGSIIENKNIQYVPTGVHSSEVKRSKSEVLKEMGIPQDAVVICYAGRHNHIKGYDLLKSFGEIILNKYPNCYFLILGKEEPLEGLNHERWKEVGWTTDPFSYINAASVFALPNRETYFDLILIEILSLGKSCLLSNSGGNKHFHFLENHGFTFFQPGNLESMVTAFESIDFNQDHSDFISEMYNSDYTLDAFGTNYLSFYNQL